MKKVAQLKSEILSAVYPSGVKENLMTPLIEGQKSPMDMLFDEGFNYLQKWIEIERTPNTDLVRFCRTNFKCGLTVLDKPRGDVLRVYTVGDDKYCDPVFLRQVDWPVPEAEAMRFRGTRATNTAAVLPLGFQPADASTDSPAGRSRAGIWTINRNNIYIWPWIQSNELVVVEWDGIKTDWKPDDLVNDSIEYRTTIQAWIEYGRRRDWEDKANVGTYKTLWDEAFQDYAWLVRKLARRKDSYAYPSDAVNNVQQNVITGSSSQQSFNGSWNIPIGVSEDTVSGILVPFQPRTVKLSVSVPDGGLNLWANDIIGSLTTDGFRYKLNGITDSTEYVLNYEIT
jgi:hypothetical protein